MKTTLRIQWITISTIILLGTNQAKAVHIDVPTSWTHTLADYTSNCGNHVMNVSSTWSNLQTFTVYCNYPGDANWTVKNSYEVFYSATGAFGTFNQIATVNNTPLAGTYTATQTGYYYMDWFSVIVTVASGPCAGYVSPSYGVNGKTGTVFIQVYSQIPSNPTSVTRHLVTNGACPSYNAYCSPVSDATSYDWHEGSCSGYNWQPGTYVTTTSNYYGSYIACDETTVSVCVRARNPCGTSIQSKGATLGIPCPNTCDFHKQENTMDLQGGYSIYPNPASTSLTIEGLNKDAGNITFELMTITGQQVLQTHWNADAGGNMVIDISKASPGIYILKAYNSKINFSKKLIIQR